MARRRAYIVFFLLMAMLAAAGYSITQVSGGAEYVDAAGRQGVYKLEVAKARGPYQLVPSAGGGDCSGQ